MNTATTQEPLALQLSTFKNVKSDPVRKTWSWADLCDALAEPPEYASKAACPLLKLATFGGQRTSKGSLRHDDNLMEIYGLEGDYDEGHTTLAEAADLLGKHGIAALLYSTPSSTSEKPRWRVLAPLSTPCLPGERAQYVALLNGVLGGILARESFASSQIYFFGRTTGKGYECVRVLGTPIDQLDPAKLPSPIYPGKTTAPAAGQRQTVQQPAPAYDAIDQGIALARVTDDTLAELESALGVNPATGAPWIDSDDRATWIAVAHDLKSLGDAGRQLWLTWSAHSAKFEDGRDDPDKVWDGCSGRHADFRAVFAKAQAAGWVNPKSAAAALLQADAHTLQDRTDAGNVAVLAELTEGSMRFVNDRKLWLRWDGAAWQTDVSGIQAQRAAMAVGWRYLAKALDVQKQANDPSNSSEDAKRLHKTAASIKAWGEACRSKPLLERMLSLATRDERFALDAARLDADPYLFGTANGVVDLHTGQLREAGRNEFVTQRSPIAFDPTASASRWAQFIDEITAAPDSSSSCGYRLRPALARYLQKALGYCLTGSTAEQKIFIAVGAGSNGKNVLLDMVQYVMGDYCDTMAAESLMTSKSSASAEQANPQLRKLQGVRLAVANESKAGHSLDTGIVKLHSGGGYVTARALHENPVQFTISHKLLLMTNHRPAIAELDEAIRGRLHIIPFDMRWNRPGHTERNPDLPDGDKELAAQLKGEAPGVLAWLVAGAVAYLRDGLEPPAEVTGTTRAYLAAQDPLVQFLATLEPCDARQGTSASASASALFTAFQAWAEDEGRDDGPATATAFGRALKARGIASIKGKDVTRYALRLMDEDALA